MNKDLLDGYIIFFCMLAIGIASVFVSWTTIILVIAAIIVIAIIISSAKGSEKKNVIYKMTEEPFKNTRLYIDKNGINKEKIIEQIGMFDKSIYDSMFDPEIMKRGEKYFNENKIKDFKKDGNKYSCKINGTEEYDVSLTLDENNKDEIIDAFCSCPYFTDGDKNCKHLYALLYRIKCGKNRKLIEEAVNEHIIAVAKMGEEFNKFVKERKNKDLKAGEDATKRLDEVIEEYSRIAEVFKKENKKEEKLEDELLEVVMALVKNTIKYKTIIELIINLTYNNSSNNGSTNYDAQTLNSIQGIGVKEVLSGLIITDEIDKKIKKRNNQKREAKSDKEYTWNFEEDDYYSEDE